MEKCSDRISEKLSHQKLKKIMMFLSFLTIHLPISTMVITNHFSPLYFLPVEVHTIILSFLEKDRESDSECIQRTQKPLTFDISWYGRLMEYYECKGLEHTNADSKKMYEVAWNKLLFLETRYKRYLGSYEPRLTLVKTSFERTFTQLIDLNHFIQKIVSTESSENFITCMALSPNQKVWAHVQTTYNKHCEWMYTHRLIMYDRTNKKSEMYDLKDSLIKSIAFNRQSTKCVVHIEEYKDSQPVNRHAIFSMAHRPDTLQTYFAKRLVCKNLQNSTHT